MSTEELTQAAVGALFGIFGAPDDPAVAEAADDTLAALHDALAAN
ncbi:hypothetical protein [Actinokineospora iranica]|uniref:Uncharacterized protein n=1 Tax=Actinokineospora iranica TaxID=1271860 RepID=A0A1G6SMA8_9PSEU|nr:hypothetical protein [Actinokineospora iranica]SDD17761.1 hypothetical protein SAMN05216174_10853 [Actinokineospora iranica]